MSMFTKNNVEKLKILYDRKAMLVKFSNFISDFKKYDLEQRIKKTALKVFEKNISHHAFASKLTKNLGFPTSYRPYSNNDNILTKIRVLVENFKKYDLEKRIPKMAIDAVKHELIPEQIKETAIQGLKAKILEESNKKKGDISEKIKQLAIDAVKHELIPEQIKETAIQGLKAKILEESNKKKGDISEKIKQLAIDAVKHELIPEQIKETAIQGLKVKILKESKSKQKKEIIKFFISIHLPLIKTIIAIKTAAINAVKNSTTTKSIDEQLQDLLVELEDYNKIMNDTTKTKDERKNAEEERKKTLEAYKKLVKTIPDKDKKIAALEILLEKSEQSNNSNKESNVRLQTEIVELKQTNLQNELKNVAINKVLSSLPKVAEPKIDVKPLIENVAINKVKDALNYAVINDLKTKIAESETKLKSSIEANVKRDLEEIAIKTVESATTGSAKTAPGTSTGPNIENDLKNAAINALYRALLGVPRETIKPIDITKPQDKFDILITDKTYDYKDGKQTENTGLTKYDIILANLAK